MLSIRRSEVPLYLHDSGFYESLCPDDDEELSIPQDSCKQDDFVTDENSLRYLLATLRFWGLNYIPETLYNFVVNANRALVEVVAADFSTELVYLPALQKFHTIRAERRLIIAAGAGSVELIMFLVRQGSVASAEVAEAAAEKGHLKCLQYLHSIGCPWQKSTCFAAARGGHIDCLRFAISNGCDWSKEFIGHSAASGGNLPCLQYVAEKGCALEKAMLTKAGIASAIDCVEYLHSKNVPFSDSFVYEMVCADSKECLQFALDHDCTFHDNTLCAVNSMECLQILHNSNHAWTVQSSAWAAQKGITVLKFLHERGCPWDESTYTYALNAYVSFDTILDCIEYAHDNGCPWSRVTSQKAVEVGNIPAVQYLLTHGCPFDSVHPSIAAGYNNIKMLTLLHTRGVAWDEQTTGSLLFPVR